MLIVAITLTSCQAITDIFKAGVWFGVIGIIVIIVIIFWLISKAGKKYEGRILFHFLFKEYLKLYL